MVNSSWVVIRKADGVVICETFQASVVEALNTDKYYAEPITEYLPRINRQEREKQVGRAMHFAADLSAGRTLYQTACGKLAPMDRAMGADYAFYVDCDGCKAAAKQAREALAGGA